MNGTTKNLAIAGDSSSNNIRIHDMASSKVLCNISIGVDFLAITTINSTSAAFFSKTGNWSNIGVLNLQSTTNQTVYLNKGSSNVTNNVEYDASRNYLINDHGYVVQVT